MSLRQVELFVAVILSTGCGLQINARNNMEPLVNGLVNLGRQSTDDTLKVLIPAYVETLDSLRILNIETTVEQRRKRDVLQGLSMGFSALSLGIASTEMEDGVKASITGALAALGGLFTGLNAKFRHEEDAAVSEVCTKLAEGELITFVFPPNVDSLRSRINRFNDSWKEAGCGGAQVRKGKKQGADQKAKEKADSTTVSAPA